MTPYILLFFGLFFILIEFYLPGIIMGVIGTILLLSGLVVFAQQSESLFTTLLFALAEIVMVGLLIKYALKMIPKARPGLSIYLKSDQTGYQASSYDEAAIGKKGIVVADLKPGGYILIDGMKQQAISQSGYIARGAEVQVIGGEADNLIVIQTKIKKEEAS